MDDSINASTIQSDVMHVSFETWTQRRQVPTLGTNAGAQKLPFQTWHHFKEAFAPELVARAIQECRRPVTRCLDPFGGSGTTALACQFLGVEPVTVEVNPYLGDLIEAKLYSYDSDELVRSLSDIINNLKRSNSSLKRFAQLPPTFIESADLDRWIFDKPIARRIAGYLDAIDLLQDEAHRRFFKVQLGGMLVQISNVRINGKGRRYRRNWESHENTPRQLDSLFCERAQRAIVEVHAHRFRQCQSYTLLRGDCRSALAELEPVDIAIFSPPYPNSFDYTDVYNVELWMLDYLQDSGDNRELRQSTLCSHVQIKREFSQAPAGSKKLTKALRALRNVRDSLWSPWIPEMVGGYFSDMQKVMKDLHVCLADEGELWAVVGDSRYAGIQVPTAGILAELAPVIGYEVVNVESFRSMRSSAQQGGKAELDETLLVLRKLK